MALPEVKNLKNARYLIGYKDWAQATAKKTIITIIYNNYMQKMSIQYTVPRFKPLECESLPITT